jgi:protein O-mannosyl-transferase
MRRNINKSARGLHVQGADRLPERRAPIGLLVVLTIAVCAVVLVTHWPALSAKALSFDDEQYFVKNFLVRNPSWKSAGRFLAEVFEPSTVHGYYQPLSMISLMLDYALGGQSNNMLPFHRTSLLLHVANTALIIVLLYQLFGWAWVAAGVGLLFGVHPLMVEPISWVGERKTLLAAFFALWSLVLYVRYSHRNNWKTFLGCVVMYVLALMSKPTSTPLPVLMLLMDYWPLRRLSWRTVQEKLPFFVIGGISAVITVISQSRTCLLIAPESYGPMRVPLVICHNIIFYLYKMIWPVDLSAHYAFPDQLGFSTPMIMIGVIGTFILIPVLVVSLRWTRAAITGWLIFFVMIFPTIQIFQFGNVIAADRFAYLPSIGILMIAASFLGWVCGGDGVHRHKARCVTVVIVVLILAGAECFATRRYLANWKDTLSFSAHMVKVTPNAAAPRMSLGLALLNEKGDIKGAIECFTEVLKIRPDDVDAHVNLGAALVASKDRIDEAIECYKKAIQLNSKSFDAHYNLALALVQQGRFNEAVEHFTEAAKINPNSFEAHYNLALALAQQGQFDEAIEHFAKAVKIAPNNVDAHYNLAAMLMQRGRIDEAASECNLVLRLQPRDADAHSVLGDILVRKGRSEEAAAEYREALKINPQHPKAQNGLKNILSKQQPDQPAK